MSKEAYTPPPTNKEAYTPPVAGASGAAQSFAAVPPRAAAPISYLCAGLTLTVGGKLNSRLWSFQLYWTEGTDSM
jgi:hypothetical protein